MKKSNNQFKNTNVIWVAIAIIVIFLIGLKFTFGATDTILIERDKVIIEGKYGEEIKLNEIAILKLSDTLPKIIGRSNGYDSGDVRKGYFKTSRKKRIKLILNNSSKPYLFIQTSKGKKIYFSESKELNKQLLNKIQVAIKKYNPNHIIF